MAPKKTKDDKDQDKKVSTFAVDEDWDEPVDPRLLIEDWEPKHRWSGWGE